MSLAIKKALIEGKDLVETMVTVGRGYPFCGYGGRFYKWIKCDSDTFGAIAGGVAEEFYGGFGDIDAEGLLKNYLTEELYEILIA